MKEIAAYVGMVLITRAGALALDAVREGREPGLSRELRAARAKLLREKLK